MVTVPTYPPVRTPAVWNAWMAAVESWRSGFVGTGTYVNNYDYIVIKNGSDYEANNAFQTIYGGAADAGGIDGADGYAVIQECIDDCEAAGGGRTLLKGPADFEVDTTLTIQATDVWLDGCCLARVKDVSGGADATIKIGDYAGVGMLYHCGINGLRVIREVGNEGTGDILELNGVESGRFNDVWLYSGCGRGLFLNQHCYFNVFNGLYVNSVPRGIHLYSPKATPTVNVNHFFGTLVGVGNAAAATDAEYGVYVQYSNLNNFYGLNVEPRASYTPRPDGVIIYGCSSTLLNGVRVGENYLTNAIAIGGDSDKLSYMTTVNHANLQLSITGIQVDYAATTCLNGIRGSSITSQLIELTANHVDTTLGVLNLAAGTNYILDGNINETMYLDQKQNRQKMFFTCTTAANQTNKQIAYVGLGMATKDLQIDRLSVTLVSTPGAGETCSVNLTDGVDSMTVSIANPDVTGTTTVGAYDWDVSNKALLLRYTTSAGAAVSLLTVCIEYHEKWTN